LQESLLVSAGYDADEKKAFLMFYSPKEERIFIWKDNTNHKPYCFTKVDDSELARLRARPDVVAIEDYVKMDMFTNKPVEVHKIIVTNPLSIGGGKGEQSLRNIIPCYEADIKYYENYLYDFQYSPGTFFKIENNHPIPIVLEADKIFQKELETLEVTSKLEFRPFVVTWSKLLTQPLPRIKRSSLDIEVASPDESHIPSPNEAEHPVIAVAMYASDNAKKVFLLKRNNVSNVDPYIEGAEVVFFDQEESLIEAVSFISWTTPS
jgi:DNA polymerase I